MKNVVPLAEEFPGKDAAVLRSLMGLMALPALWAGKGEKTILQLMTDAVASVVPLSGQGADAGPVDAPIRVMVVDDNLDALETLETLLTLYGFEVNAASMPEQALQQSTAFAANAYVLDIGLPGMDRYQLAAALRQRDAGAKLAAQFIALTGYGQEGDKARSLAAGFHMHLTKPANIEDLLAALRDGPNGAGAHKTSLLVPDAVRPHHQTVTSPMVGSGGM